MMEVMAAAITAVKFGSAVMAAVAALTVSARDDGRTDCSFGCESWGPSLTGDI